MTSFEFITADVFTDQPFGGNPLAVFPDAGEIRAADMQRIARELNLSETVFVMPPTGRDCVKRLRIFTPATELPFAGHPTVGAALVLAEIGAISGSTDSLHVTFEEGAGPVPVHVARGPNGRTATLTSPQRPVVEAAVTPRETMARVLGLSVDDLAPDSSPVVASAGVAFTFVPVRDRTVLSRACVDEATWRQSVGATAAPHLYVITMDDWTGGNVVQARMFAPALGIPEDPATGSAAAALPGVLAGCRSLADGTAHWTVHQGIDMGRPSVMEVAADIDAGRITAVRVGGKAVVMSRGSFSGGGVLKSA